MARMDLEQPVSVDVLLVENAEENACAGREDQG
jgi:hypothetical protein